MNGGKMSANALANEAALWVIRREEPNWSDADECAFRQWLDTSMAHRAAFWRLEHIWAQADRVAALGTAGRPRRARFAEKWRRALPPRVAAAAAAIAGVVALSVVGLVWRPAPRVVAGPSPITYRTTVGGQGRIGLADGSNVTLNTATTLRAARDGADREVWLDQGEAFFDIVHRTDRRFVVHAGRQTVTVLGTRFSVRRDGQKVTVAVISGRVRIDDARTGETRTQTAFVASGDVAVVGAQSMLVTPAGQTDVTAMTAWRDGMIVFDDAPLPRALAEFNRYTSRPIQISDPALAQLRIGGSFRIGDSAAFTALLHRAYGVEVTPEEGTLKLTR